ncbi:MAG TPA: hypothetical protein VJ892_02345 [Candidatus Absconditabacterales bacterium]|nr:hypothetical protein [Candidatus Absconditabacterales bacterium]
MFIGKKSRKIDQKKRITIPVKWRKNEYVLVNDDEIKVYKFDAWLKIFDNLDEEEKIMLSLKSHHLKPDKNSRIILPNFVNFRFVNLIGMKDYFILKKSDE